MANDRNWISSCDRYRSNVWVPATIRTGSRNGSSYDGRITYRSRDPSSSGYTWFSRAAASHRADSSATRSGCWAARSVVSVRSAARS